MSKWLSLLALLAMLMLPMPARAQSPITFDNVDVGVWPEYDTPTVLVIYKMALSPQTQLPVDVTLRVPASVEKASVVAVGPAAESVSDQGVEYKFTPGGDYASVKIKATALFIQVEYYDTNLQKNGNQHKYAYEWPGDYAVTNFRFELRQPLKASNLNSEPALTSTGVDGQGFEFSEYKQTGLTAGNKLPFTFMYVRDTDAPSTSFLKVESSTPLDQNVPGQSTWTTYLPWILGGLGLVLLLIALGVYLASGRQGRMSATRGRKRHPVRSEIEPESAGGQAHCSQCGKRAQPGDRFCRVCGARIRRGEA